MFDRLRKPFLTVETGEAYQPIRLAFNLVQLEQVQSALANLGCLQKSTAANSWNWYWKAECEHLHFESLESFKKNPDHPVRLGMLSIKENTLYINLPSFKRACLAVAFFHLMLDKLAIAHHADFINKVFAIDERLSHGFTEVFKENELEDILRQRMDDFQQVQQQCEEASTAEDALMILSEYTKRESGKRLPYAERYSFELDNENNSEMVFLGFYIFLRSRELVAIKRWSGETGYTLSDAADEVVEQAFGGMGIDFVG